MDKTFSILSKQAQQTLAGFKQVGVIPICWFGYTYHQHAQPK